MIANIFNTEEHIINVPDILALGPGDNENVDMPNTPDAMFIEDMQYNHGANNFINDGNYRIDYNINIENNEILGFSFVRAGGGLGTTVTYVAA